MRHQGEELAVLLLGTEVELGPRQGTAVLVLESAAAVVGEMEDEQVALVGGLVVAEELQLGGDDATGVLQDAIHVVVARAVDHELVDASAHLEAVDLVGADLERTVQEVVVVPGPVATVVRGEGGGADPVLGALDLESDLLVRAALDAEEHARSVDEGVIGGEVRGTDREFGGEDAVADLDVLAAGPVDLPGRLVAFGDAQVAAGGPRVERDHVARVLAHQITARDPAGQTQDQGIPADGVDLQFEFEMAGRRIGDAQGDPLARGGHASSCVFDEPGRTSPGQRGPVPDGHSVTFTTSSRWMSRTLSSVRKMSRSMARSPGTTPRSPTSPRAIICATIDVG